MNNKLLLGLRDELNHVVDTPASTHRRAIEELKKRFPHTIELQPPFISGLFKEEYTCYMYALNMLENQELYDYYFQRRRKATRSRRGDYFLVEFIQYLVDDARLLPAEDGIILYFDAGRPVHAGKKSGEYVVSKWGNGNLWKHGIFEVPAVYGTTFKAYQEFSPEEVKKVFIEYCL